MSETGSPSAEVLYEMTVAARLRFADEAQGQDRPEDIIADEIGQFIDEAIGDYEFTIGEHEAAANELGFPFEAPAYLLDSLATLTRRIRALERFRDRLIAFARSYAIDPESMRVIATATGLSHTTIMRIAGDAAVREVADAAGPVAEEMLGRLSPRENPDLYARLSAIANQARQATRS